jgi:hypothetical protein
MKNIKLSKFTLLQVQMWDSSIIHALSWIFMKKYQNFKVHSFPSSDVLFIPFHEFSWKNIKLSKFTFFPVQMWDSSIIHALSRIFIKNIKFSKLTFLPSSDVRIKYYSCAFMNFHEKISNFQKFALFQLKYPLLKLKYYSCVFMNFHEKYQTFKDPSFPSSDVKFK